MIDPHDTLTGDLLTQRPSRKSVLNHLAETRLQLKALRAQEDRLCRELAKDCQHEEVREYQWEHDDGYGRQSQNEGLQCTICGAINYYLVPNRWSVGRYHLRG